jgi:hypothetical protein
MGDSAAEGGANGSTGGMIETGDVYDATSAAIASARASSSKAAVSASAPGGVYVDRRTPVGTYGSGSAPCAPVSDGSSVMLGF